MITEDGPKVVEFNCRFGDPECQIILPALQSDLLKMMWEAAEGGLSDEEIDCDGKYHCCVVLPSGGYPNAYEPGLPIRGIEHVDTNALVSHAGTRDENGELSTNGGRVLNVVGNGETLEDAIQDTYKEVKKIFFEGVHYRSDIGVKGLVYFEE